MNTTGRFLSMDPLAEKYYHLSPYAYCAGDPVNFVDPDGRIFTDSLAKYVSILKNDINAEIQKLSKNKSEANAEKKAELYQALTEFDEMEKSIQLYDIDLTPGSPDGADPDVEYYGWTEYDIETNSVVIKISVDSSDKIFNYTLIHELKHAYQFETGYLTFHSDGKQGGHYYDYTDEEEAFRRAYALGYNEKMPNEVYEYFKNIRGESRYISNSEEDKKIIRTNIAHPRFYEYK